MSLPDDFPLIEQHPPERGGPRNKAVVLYSCCCCCCCCLHTVGAFVGALVGGMPPSQPPGEKQSFYPDQGMFWTSFLVALVLTSIGTFLSSLAQLQPGREADLFFVSGGTLLVLLVIFGPLFLLAACIIMAIRIPFADAEERGGYWRQLAWITGGVILGTIIGIASMALVPLFLR